MAKVSCRAYIVMAYILILYIVMAEVSCRFVGPSSGPILASWSSLHFLRAIFTYCRTCMLMRAPRWGPAMHNSCSKQA